MSRHFACLEGIGEALSGASCEAGPWVFSSTDEHSADRTLITCHLYLAVGLVSRRSPERARPRLAVLLPETSVAWDGTVGRDRGLRRQVATATVMGLLVPERQAGARRSVHDGFRVHSNISAHLLKCHSLAKQEQFGQARRIDVGKRKGAKGLSEPRHAATLGRRLPWASLILAPSPSGIAHNDGVLVRTCPSKTAAV